MARAPAKETVPAEGNSAKTWRRSWMLGYGSAVVAQPARYRVRRVTALAGIGDGGRGGILRASR